MFKCGRGIPLLTNSTNASYFFHFFPYQLVPIEAEVGRPPALANKTAAFVSSPL